MPTDEAIDLILSLPAGSLFRAALNPVNAWTEDQHRGALTVDLLTIINWRLMGCPPEHKPDLIERPGDAERKALAKKRAQEARKKIENTKWRAV